MCNCNYKTFTFCTLSCINLTQSIDYTQTSKLSAHEFKSDIGCIVAMHVYTLTFVKTSKTLGGINHIS